MSEPCVLTPEEAADLLPWVHGAASEVYDETQLKAFRESTPAGRAMVRLEQAAEAIGRG